MPHIFNSHRMCGIILPMGGLKKERVNLIKVFFIAFAVFSLAMLPSIILTKGIWIYYGDFNVQQIPFYIHVHDAIRAHSFPYDFCTDLGGSLIGCYSFYLLGSPFFWLSVPFPSEAVPYLIPWITALKYSIMAVTAYVYIRRHLKTDLGAFSGALLFAFSGFQGAVLVYNHFHDAIAFFPLYLYLFENLFNTADKKELIRRRLAFIFMTALMLIINYYFFAGQVVFLIIYYFCTRKPTARELLRAFSTGLCGVCLAGVYIIPAAYYTIFNSRVTDVLEGYNLLAYPESTLILGIIKNIVMLPDISGLNSMFNQAGSRVSGIGGYLPLFSIAGVIAFFLYNREENFMKRIMTICALCALVPVLNSLFSAMNSEYYARWYYMPVLIMAMMTGSVIEEREETCPYIKRGAFVVGTITIAITFAGILPAKTEEGAWSVLGALKNYEQLISEIAFSVVMFFLLILYVKVLSKKSDRITRLSVVIACFLTTATMFWTGTVLVDKDRKADYVAQAVFGESPLPKDEGFYRFETDQDFYNYPLMWEGSHCISSFISTIPGSTVEVYHDLGMPRKVTSNPYTSRIGFRAICASKYFLSNNMHSIERIGHINDMSELKDYEPVNVKNGFSIYENRNALPMGIIFDSFIYKDEYSDCGYSNNAKDRMLVDVLILDDNASDYYDYVSHADISLYKEISVSRFEKMCEAKKVKACTDFETSASGFSANAVLDEPSAVLFSVPYETGFTAYIDGKETEIIEADYGFMAVMVKAGEHHIEFKYTQSYFNYGVYASLFGILLFTAIFIYGIIPDRKTQKMCSNVEKPIDESV